MSTTRFALKTSLATLLGLASLAAAADNRYFLSAPANIGINDTLVSPNGRAMAMQQSDGNFCVWGGSPATARPYDASWCHMKVNQFLNMEHAKYYTAIQTDGNLCTYSDKGRNATWCTMAYGPAGSYYVILDNHGNLCTHKGPDPQHDYGVMWCTMDTSGAAPAVPNVIDVSSTLAETFNSDASAWRNLAQAVGASKPDQFYIESIKVTQLQNTAFNFTPPKGVLVGVDTQEIVNCDDTQVTREVDFATDVTNSISLSKSKTFDTSVSATVSYSGLFASGSVTATAGYSMTDSSETSNTNASHVENKTTITFEPHGGRIAQLKVLMQQGQAVPWQASFVPSDTQPIAITARRIGNNERASATLQWNQVKSYLPPSKQALVLTGTLDINRVDPYSGALVTTWAMAQSDLDQICSAPPPVLPGGANSLALARGATPSAMSATAGFATVAPKQQRGIVQRKLTPAEAAAKISNAKPLTGS
ncbi:MAG TPA: hypothetical protein VNU28_01565 [Solirubrobacteraceae bacterium]|jgi:hypothetical protein|nr:hypothetical protein [Solirubrobacteraceae bacterium]